MKKIDQLKLVESFQYLRYSHISLLALVAGMVLLIPLMVFGVLAGEIMGLVATVYGLFVFIMWLCQVIFLFNGYNGLRKVESIEYNEEAKSIYSFVVAYFSIMIGGYLLQKFTDSPQLAIILSFAKTVFLLVIHYKTFKLLQHELLNGRESRNIGEILIWIIAGVEVISLLAKFAHFSPIIAVVNFSVNNFSFQVSDFSSVLVSIFLLLELKYAIEKVEKYKIDPVKKPAPTKRRAPVRKGH